MLTVDTSSRLDVIVECCETRLPYGFEFLGSSFCGGAHRLYLPLPTDRARVNAFQGLASGVGVAVTGGASVGKAETVRHLGGALGHSVMQMECSGSTDAGTITTALTASFAGCVCVVLSSCVMWSSFVYAMFQPFMCRVAVCMTVLGGTVGGCRIVIVFLPVRVRQPRCLYAASRDVVIYCFVFSTSLPLSLTRPCDRVTVSFPLSPAACG